MPRLRPRARTFAFDTAGAGAERHDVVAVPFDEIAETVGRTPAACRQLAASGRRRIEASRMRRARRAEHDPVAVTRAQGGAEGRRVKNRPSLPRSATPRSRPVEPGP